LQMWRRLRAVAYRAARCRCDIWPINNRPQVANPPHDMSPLLYSILRATMGSTLAARDAGIRQAARPVASRVSDTAA